jgi:hypothetical protein
VESLRLSEKPGRANELNEVDFATVARAFAMGKLGSEEALARRFDRDVAGLPGYGKSFFNDEGRLIPYETLTAHQRDTVNGWMHAIVSIDLASAEQRRLPRIEKECGQGS